MVSVDPNTASRSVQVAAEEALHWQSQGGGTNVIIVPGDCQSKSRQPCLNYSNLPMP